LGLIIEDFIPGREYALEGTLERGELTTLALFDKPDPMDGPYFEETLYITPSRLPEVLQDCIHEDVARACRVAGLAAGPVHAEVRVNDQGVDRKSTRLNSSHVAISYAVFCLKKKNKNVSARNAAHS